MTELTTLLFPTATAASSLAPAAPVSVTGVPVVAGQFAQTLGELLAGTPAVAAAAPAAPAPAAVQPDTVQSLPVLGLVGPLPNGKLLATGMTDRQPLADDGNVVPAEPAFQLLANPAWRATVATPAAPPRTPVSLRTALERAAAQLATPTLAKAARGANTTPAADAPAEESEAVSVLSDTTTNDPAAPPLDLLASVPVIPTAMLPITPLPPEHTTEADAAMDSSGPVVATSIEHSPGNPPSVAHPMAASTRAGRPASSDQAILTALGALPNPEGGGMGEGAATVVLATPLPITSRSTPTATLPVAVTAAPSPPQARTPTTVPAATDALPLATATTSAALNGHTPAVTADMPAHGETVPVRADRSIVPPISVSTTPQPAGQVFAAALASATTWRDRPVAERTDPTAPTPPLGFTTAVDLGSTTPVQPTGTAQRAPLDLTQDSGVQRMIDHIEVLRDDADSRDTRIRLVPDALGSVGVAVRQVGERIHVSFTAEHEATRALIADAQPRLTELAAERGVRIAGTSVATDANPGSSQSPAQGQGQPQSQSQPQSQNPSQSRPNAPQQPPRAAARAQRDQETPEDQRLA
jgi:flagellar hook-length control protein FliK